MAEKSNIEFPSYSPSNSEKRNVIANAAFIAAMAGSLASCKANSNKELYTVQEPTPVTQPLDNDDIEIFNNKTQEELQHTGGYWTATTSEDERPDISKMDIVAGHTDMGENDYATLYLHINNQERTHKGLYGQYFDGYSGELTKENIDQITEEIEERVKIHIKGFEIGKIVIVDKPEIEEEDLRHIKDWTTASEEIPDFSQFDIISCHSDPDKNGNASIIFFVRGEEAIAEDMIREDMIEKGKYFNGFKGVFNKEAEERIIKDLEGIINPHVSGFYLTKVKVINLP